MARPRKPPPPPKRDGKFDYPDLWFDWLAGRLATQLREISSVSVPASIALFALFLTGWLGSSEDNTLRPVFAIATTVCGICMTVAWATKGFRSTLRKEVAITLQGSAAVGVALMVGLVVIALWYQDSVRASVRRAEAPGA